MHDADFQEKMFAKQMAIVKGQAWNVVETLKTPDHGPLELTRRARVCVWDDLVDVPVAVPLRTQSSEIRRHKSSSNHHPEEMDISAAGASSSKPNHDLVKLGNSPAGKSDQSNRFNISRQSSAVDVTQDGDVTEHGTTSGTLSPPNVRAMSTSPLDDAERTLRPNHHSRMSFDESRSLRSQVRHARRLSHAARLSPVAKGSTVDDVDEGDLGYAVAQGREANRKRVIVERLETVKGKNPTFDWC
jgi:phosphatidylinositol 4-kinase type 2